MSASILVNVLTSVNISVATNFGGGSRHKVLLTKTIRTDSNKASSCEAGYKYCLQEIAMKPNLWRRVGDTFSTTPLLSFDVMIHRDIGIEEKRC